MDRREMKKHIAYLALAKLNQLDINAKMYELELIIDKVPSLKQLSRFERLLQEMVENAESKLR
jgi:hypothetical protein